MKTKHWIFISGIVALTIIGLLGCNTQPTAAPQPIVLTVSPTPTEAAPSPTSTVPAAAPTLAAALILPVLMGTPVPLPIEPITPDNIDRIQQLAMWGQGQVKQVAYSTDGKFLVVGSTAGLWLYDAKTLELLRFMQTIDEIMNLIFLPDSETVMAQVGSNTIIRWNAITGTLLGSWNVGVRGLDSPVFNPDGSGLASILEDGQIGLWEIETGRLLKTFRVETDVKPQIGLLAFSPDGKWLASEILSRSVTINIRLWDVETGKLLQILPHSYKSEVYLFNLVFSPDSTILTSGGRQGRLWDVKTGTLLHTLDEGGGNSAFSTDGTMLATTGKDVVHLWDVKSGKILRSLATTGVEGLTFSSTDNALVSWGSYEPVLQVWNPKTGTSLGIIEGYDDRVWSLAASSDGSIFMTNEKGNFIETQGKTGNGIRVWDVRTGQITGTIGPTIPAFRLALSANGRILASVEHEGVFNTGENPVRIWDVATGMQIQKLGPYSLELPDLALSPDGRLANVAWRVHDVQTGQTRYNLNPDLANIRNAAFSPDGKTLAYTLDSGVVKLVEAETGELRHLLSAPARYRYFNSDLTFSPDSKVLAVGYEGIDGQHGLIYLWDTNTGAILQTITVDSFHVTSLAFSPDGALLASGLLSSHTVPLWDSSTGQLLYTIKTPVAGIIHFTLEGRLLVLGMQDGTVQLWGIPPE
jgi:WD40 repeat protein